MAAIPEPASLVDEQQDRLLIRRGALSFARDPLEFWYMEEPVPLTPLESVLLALLVRRGRATWQMVDEVLRDGESSKAIRDVLVHRIRQKFQALGAENPIETVRGWGLKLRIGQDSQRRTGVLIGERKPAFAACDVHRP